MPDPLSSNASVQVAAGFETKSLPGTLEEAQSVAGGISRALRRAARTARAPASIISGGGGAKLRKGDKAFKWGIVASFFLLFGAPLIGESAYWGIVASKQYSTEVKFAIRAGQPSPLDALGGLFGLGASQQSQDTQIVADYISSRSMVEALEKKINLKEIFSYSHVDYFSRFNSDDSIESLVKYWRRRVDVKIQTISGIVDVNVRAFNPDDSLALGQHILSLSEALVNDLSARSRRDALAVAQKELERAEARLKAATEAMRDVRNTEGVLDAKSAAESLEKVVAALQLERAKLEQDLAGQSTPSADSPSARVIRARVAAITNQINDYNQKIAGVQSGAGGSMADRLGPLSRQEVELDLARGNYAQAAAVFQNARVNLETQQAYLVTSLRPTLAQEATYPRRLWEWSIIVIPSFLVWAIAAAVAFLVRENMAK